MLIKAADVDGYELLYTYYAQDSDFAPARVASAQEKDGTWPEYVYLMPDSFQNKIEIQ